MDPDPVRAAASAHRLRVIPAVGRLLTQPQMRQLESLVSRRLLSRLAHEAIDELRVSINAGMDPQMDLHALSASVAERATRLQQPRLQRVINATGIILHTNLGRAPLSRAAANHVAELAQGYSNLELDLYSGKRGSRQSHLRERLRLLTGAGDVLVVNNNAAALLLVLQTFASGREVVVSRGELIEIGDGFRLPELMRASGARLVEVGTTNRTRLSDYASAIGEETALLLKVHTSNFRIVGFTEDVPMGALAELARHRDLPSVFDLGSGMLCRPAQGMADKEPCVAEALAAGADLVTFSGDKLLGGVQAGLIAGREELILRLAKAPIMRALRPGRLTLAALDAVAIEYLNEERLLAQNPVFRMITRSAADLREVAEGLKSRLAEFGVEADVVASEAPIGGGALPGRYLPGWALRIVRKSRAEGAPDGAAVHSTLLRGQPAVLAVFKEGEVLLELRTVGDEELDSLARAVQAALVGPPTPTAPDCPSSVRR